jgi:MFS family permease
MLIGPIWNGWMGDLVPESKRGSYFSKRNQIMEMASLVSMFVGGYVLNSYKNFFLIPNGEYIGFALLFFIAFGSRMVSFYYLTKKYEPEYKPTNESRLRFFPFLKSISSNHYGTYVKYVCFLNFGVFISSPFFVPYMLKELKFDYMTLTIVNITPIIAKFGIMRLWGKLCDQYGSKKILALVGFLIPLCPILWLFSDNFWYLLLIQVYSGLVWSGFDIANINFVFENTSREQRVACISYYNVLNGVAIFVGGFIGGWIIQYHWVFSSQYFVVFLVSGLIRYVAFASLVPKLYQTH